MKQCLVQPDKLKTSSWQDDKCVLSFDLRNNDYVQASNCCEVKEFIPAKFFFKAAFTILKNPP